VLLRSLVHHWRLNLAVAAGAAVATAVLTGALVVGDSVRGSLRTLTEERLGAIDLAVLSQGMFQEDLGERILDAETGGTGLTASAPAIALQGTAENADTGARAARVAVWGVDQRFAELFPAGSEAGDAGILPLDRGEGQIFPSVTINGALARELGVEPGADVLLSFESLSEVPRETLLGRSDPGSALDSLRVTVRAVLPDHGGGPALFGLTPHQSVPLNAYVPLAALQRELDRRGEANALLVAADGDGGSEGQGPGAERALAARLAGTVTLDDLGLRVETQEIAGTSFVAVQSREFVLRPPVADAVEGLAKDLGAATQPALTYLANSMTVGDRTMPYSTVAALPLPPDPAFAGLELLGDGTEEASLPDLGPDDLLLDAWAAEDLGAAPGDTLEMTYYGVGADDELTTESHTFRVAGVVAMEGLAADASLTPDFPGIADAEDISGWDPPFPVDLSVVRPADEEYWDRYRGTPKAFVSLETGQRLWGNRFGDLTSIRLASPPGSPGGAPAAGPEGLFELVQEQVAPAIDPTAVGFTVLPVRRRGLEAASGATDFTGLFIGFSFFVIAAAALLVGLLFSLAVERRAPEAGLLLAVGYPPRTVGRRLLAEGLVLAVFGALAGTALAVGYAAFLLTALGSWWKPILGELGGSLLELHVEPVTLAMGFTASVLVVLVTVGWAVRRLKKVPVTRLLRGTSTVVESTGRAARRTRWIAWGALALGLVLLMVAGIQGESSPDLFFGAGAALLTAGLAFFALWCRRDPGGLERLAEAGGAATLAGLATRNSARSPGRSLLSVALVASAAFVLVAVGAFRKSGEHDLGLRSGAGGFELVAETSVPLRRDLEDSDDQAELGISEETAALLADAQVFPLRLRPGEDASCLNLYRPERPRLLGVTPALVERGGFHFRDVIAGAEDLENPWELLERPLDEGVVPAIGDYASVRWILQLGLGDELELTDERGEPLRLRIVAQLEGSIYQSELLIPEEAFLQHFPSRGGFGYFLIDTGESAGETASHGNDRELATALESDLERLGFDATSTRERLASFEAVENTYLTTFQALGGLGLLLGTLGLGVVLIKNVLERRAELATLRAFGFRRKTLASLVVIENAFLLLVGLGVGGVSGLAAVAPHLLAGGGEVPWASLGATLGAVFLVGLLASLTAVVATLRVPLLPVLKAE